MSGITGDSDTIDYITIDGTPVTEVVIDGDIAWEDAYYVIQNISAPGSVDVDESFNVSADVVNTGDGRGSQNVSYNRGGSINVTLDGGLSQNVSFNDSIGSPGTYTLTISSNQTSDSTNIDVIDPITVVESFESGNLDNYSGNKDAFTFNGGTGGAYDGSNYVQGYWGGTGWYGIASTSGLPAYPSRGDTITYHIRPETEADCLGGFQFGLQDEQIGFNSSGYAFYVNPYYSNIYLQRFDGGSSGPDAINTNAVGASGTWLEVKIDWGASDITATATNLSNSNEASVTLTDTTYDSGGIGFIGRYGTSGARFDHDYVYFR